MTERPYRVVCFDLDGTLLPLDMGAFMQRYFALLGPRVMSHGITAEAFGAGMRQGINAMAANDDDQGNAHAFWTTFFRFVDRDAADWNEVFTRFYADEFGGIGSDIVPDPAAARTVDALVAKGYPVVLTTMPMFPLRAVQWRVQWAGVDPGKFSRITTFDNSTSVKPKLAYFAENLAAMGVRGQDVLMVGNNTVEDLSFMQLGADAFLVTDGLIDPVGYDLESVRHGSLAQLADWVGTLPACEEPARGIDPGLVPAAERDRVLAGYLSDEARAADERAAGEHFKIYGVED